MMISPMEKTEMEVLTFKKRIEWRNAMETAQKSEDFRLRYKGLLDRAPGLKIRVFYFDDDIQDYGVGTMATVIVKAPWLNNPLKKTAHVTNEAEEYDLVCELVEDAINQWQLVPK